MHIIYFILVLGKRKDDESMKTKESRCIAIYARKSKFTHTGESIAIQISKCENYIRSLPEYNERTDIEIYQDEGYSGGNINRPDFQRLLTDCMADKVSIIVCYRLDRISRNLADFTQLNENLKKHKTSFVSLSENFDTSSPLGEAMLNMSIVFAQMERSTITARIRDNMLGLAQTGRWLGGTTPLGYQSIQLEHNDNITGKIRYSHKLKTIPDEEIIYHNLINKYLEKGSLTAVETFSHQTGLRTRNGKYFSRYAIQAILKNPVYAAADTDTYQYFKSVNAKICMDVSRFNGTYGLMVYNKLDQSSGKSHLEHPVEEWIVAVGEHKPFISGKQWIELQDRLKNGQKRAYRLPRKNTALLSGLIRCANCHSYMRPKNYNRTDQNGNKIFAYMCEEKSMSKGHNCNMKNPRGNDVDRFICNEIKKLPEDTDTFLQQLDIAESQLRKESDSSQSELKLLNASLNDKNKRINTLLKTLSQIDNNITLDYINKEIRKLHSEKEEIERQIEELKLIEKDKAKIYGEISSLYQKLSEFSNIFDLMAIDDKRSALRKVIKTVLWDGNNVHLYLTGSETPVSDTEIIETIEPMVRGCK